MSTLKVFARASYVVNKERKCILNYKRSVKLQLTFILRRGEEYTYL